MTISKLLAALLVVCLLTAAEPRASAQETATWTGAANDAHWDNPANWSWDLGAGVPTSTTDVVIHNLLAPIQIGPDVQAFCRNLTIDGGNSNQVEIGANSRLTAYGSIIQNGPHSYLADASIASMSLDHSELVFAGDQPQFVRSVLTFLSEVHINKTAGNVIIDSFCRFFVNDTLFLESNPVNIGQAAVGNLEIRKGSLIRDVHNTSTWLPAYTDMQLPPHIVCTQAPILVDEEVSYIVADVFSDAGQEEGINGTVLFPVGRSDSSYTPVTVTQTGMNTNAWNVHITAPQSVSCSGNPVSGAQAVKHGFNVVPIERNMSGVLSNIATPATITLSYNTANSSDVAPGYDTDNAVKRAYGLNQFVDCWNELPTSVQTGAGFKTMTLSDQTFFSQFGIGSTSSMSVPGAPAGEELTLYPNPAGNQITVTLERASGRNYTATVLDVAGKKVAETALDLRGTSTASLDTRALPPGAYLLRLTDERGAVQAKTFVRQ